MKKSDLALFLRLLLLFCIFGCRTTPPPAPIPPAFKEPTDLEKRLDSHRFPRLMNQLQLCCRSEATLQLFDQLSDWDVAVIDADTLISFKEYIGPEGLLRQRNPNIVTLVYFSGGDVKPNYRQPFTEWFLQGINPSWLLKDVNGKAVPFYHLPTSDWTLAQNPTTAINRFLPAFVKEKILNTNLVDGLLYDWATVHVSWLNHRKEKQNAAVDIDNDGKADSDSKVDKLWTAGYRSMLENSRREFPAGTLIVGNGGWNNGIAYRPYLNGVMIENFLEGERRSKELYGWNALMRTYADYEKGADSPQISFVMANSDKQRDSQKMRFALASTMMFDGYFCFTNRSNAYRSARWFDEYSVDIVTGSAKRELRFKGYLGAPKGDAFGAEDPAKKLERELASKQADRRAWRRDFENGIVLVNPSTTPATIDLGGSYRKIAGSVDPDFNDGRMIDRLVLNSRDGIILLNDSDVNRVAGIQHPPR